MSVKQYNDFMSYADLVIFDNPAGYWILNESAGTSVTDYSGLGNTATAAIARTKVSICPDTQYCASGASTAEYIQYPNLKAFKKDYETTSFSIEMIFKPNRVADDIVLFDAGLENGIFFSDSMVTFKINGNLTEYCKYRVSDDKTMHLVAIYSPSNIALFVDGQLVDERKINGLVLNTTASTYSTYANSGRYYVSNVAFYKYALTTSQIQKHYNEFVNTRTSPVDVVERDSGALLSLDMTTRPVSIDHIFPENTSWSKCSITNLIETNGILKFKTISPPALNSGSAAYSGGGLSLGTTQNLLVSSAGSHLGRTSGAIGGYFKFVSSIHNADNNRFNLFSLRDGDAGTIIEVYKETQNGYVKLSYTYVDGSGNSQTTTANVATPTYDVEHYIYVTWNNSAITCYYDTLGVSGSIDVKAITRPVFSSESTLTIGSSAASTYYWKSIVRRVSLYNTVPPNSDFVANTTTRYSNYTLPLDSSLNVAQGGTVTYTLNPTGAGASTEATVSWEPTSSNISVTTSSDNITYTSRNNNDFITSSYTNGSSITGDVYVKLYMYTKDSVYDLAELRRLNVRFGVASDVYFDNSRDVATMLTAWRSGPRHYPLTRHSQYDGLFFAGDGGFYTVAQANSSFSLFDSQTATAGSTRVFKTIEFFMRVQPGFQAASTYYYFSYYDGGTEYRLYYDGTNNKFTGFDACYLNGSSVASGFSMLSGVWNHIILTKAGWAGATPGSSDPGRFNFNMRYGASTKYYGHASYRNVALYPNILSSTDAANHYARYFGSDLATVTDASARTVADNPVIAGISYPQALAGGWFIVSSG